MTADLDMNSQRVINLAAPVNANDAARLLDVQAAATTGLPDQTGAAGKFLQSDGAVVTWQVPAANEVSNVPSGSLVATDVQAAIDELEAKSDNTRLLVKNISGFTLNRGEAVVITGSDGNTMTVDYANATSEATSANTIGIVEDATIANNATGYIDTQGEINNFDTSALTEGAAVWLSTTDGQITSTPPATPNHLVLLGFCKRTHATVGSLIVRVDNGFELGELHNVLITTPANGDKLEYDATLGYWKNAVGNKFIEGYSIDWVSGTTVTMNIGECFNGTNKHKLTSTLTKLVDTTYVAGTNQGGLCPTLTFTNGVAYHAFAVIDGSSNQDIAFDSSVTGATLTAQGFTVVARIGVLPPVVTGAIPLFRSWLHDNSLYIQIDVGVIILSTSSPATTKTNIATGIQDVLADIVIYKSYGALSYMWLWETAKSDVVPTANNCVIATNSSASLAAVQVDVHTDSSGNVSYRDSVGTAGACSISLRGYTCLRGDL